MIDLTFSLFVLFQEQNVELEKRITSLTEQILAANEQKEALKVRPCKAIYPDLSLWYPYHYLFCHLPFVLLSPTFSAVTFPSSK